LQQIIELNENKQYQFEEQIRELEEKLAKATEEVAAAKEKANAAPADAKPRTAAEIDNETLTDQIKHLQSRILHLEEQLEDARGQAETDSDAWQAKYNKSREAEKGVEAELQRSQAEITKLNKEAAATKERITELQGALSENQAALESARAEIETLRQEATERPDDEGEGKAAELKEQLEEADKRVTELESKVVQLEGELQSARKRSIDGDGPVGRPARKSSSSIEEAEKSIRGYHHIITEMKEENSQLKSKQADLQDEIGMLKEEIKLLQEINDSETPNGNGSGGAGEEMVKLRGTVSQQSQAIKEYEREVSELESLVESKIYREDELETRVQELEAEMERLRKSKAKPAAPAPASAPSHSRNASEQSNGSTTVSGGSTETALRCELCEGPHELDACPVFTGAPLEGGNTTPLNIKKGKKWCNDCEVSLGGSTADSQSAAHNTAECPLAEDVF
jgi:chromosome segregation ATPase